MTDALTDRLRAVASDWRAMAEGKASDADRARHEGDMETAGMMAGAANTRRACAKEIEDMIEGEG